MLISGWVTFPQRKCVKDSIVQKVDGLKRTPCPLVWGLSQGLSLARCNMGALGVTVLQSIMGALSVTVLQCNMRGSQFPAHFWPCPRLGRVLRCAACGAVLVVELYQLWSCTSCGAVPVVELYQLCTLGEACYDASGFSYNKWSKACEGVV